MKKEIRQKGANFRKCAGCGIRAKKDEYAFLRIVADKSGTVTVNPPRGSSGRGAYVCRNAECVKKLCKSKRLTKLLRCSVEEEIYEQLLAAVNEK